MTDSPLFTPEDADFLRAFSDPNYVSGDTFEMWAERAPRFLALSRRIQQWLDQQALLVDSGTSRQALLEQRHLIAPLFGESAKPVSHPMPHRYVIDETDLTEEG